MGLKWRWGEELMGGVLLGAANLLGGGLFLG